MVLCISFSLFPVNYVLAWAGVIEPAACIAVYRILSVITKGLFVVVTMDMHFDILMEAEIALITLTGMDASVCMYCTCVCIYIYICVDLYMYVCTYVCIYVKIILTILYDHVEDFKCMYV